MPLSDTARNILIDASQHPLGLAAPPIALPAAARNAVLRSLLRQQLVAEYPAQADHPNLGWRQADGTMTVMQISEAGRQAIGSDETRNAVDDAVLVGPTQAYYEAEPDDPSGPAAAAGSARTDALAEPHSESLAPPTAKPVGHCGDGGKAAGSPSRTPREASRQQALREAAQAVLAAWVTPEQPGLVGAIDALQAALVSNRPSPKGSAARGPRPDTKQATVLALLRRPEGASGPQLIEATGWAPHTVRGFLAGLGRKGIAVTVLERVRQVGPNKAGAKGSYAIYRIAEAG